MSAVNPPGGWELSEDSAAITKTYTFASFVEAMSFLSGAAASCEALGHHPEWSNVYDTVDVRLTTHDAGGLTEKDIALAERMDAVAEAVASS